MTAINAFADKVECPKAACDYKDRPEDKGLCTRRKCPFPQSVRDRWFDQAAAECSAMGDEEL